MAFGLGFSVGRRSLRRSNRRYDWFGKLHSSHGSARRANRAALKSFLSRNK